MKLKFLLLSLFISIHSFAQVVCDLTYVTTLQTFDVYHHNPSGVTLFKAKMYIDADGSPRAYGPNNSGLDWTANAGSPGNWWGIVTDGSGNPILQGASDPYPGMYVSTTSLVNSSYSSTNPLRYTNSETVPFYVLPSSVVSSGGIRIGDVAYVYNTITGQGCYAIYADAGPSTSLGEGSIYLAGQIGVNPNARTGGTSSGIIDYIVFPHSGFGQGIIPTIAQIDSIGNLKIATVGGTGITSCLEATIDNTAPSTQIAVPTGWDTASFAATFNDADNSGGSGIEKSFYQVSDYNTEWRSNNTHGFFNDDFNLPSINPEWTSVSGTWNINASGNLEQSNESLTNTNIYAPLKQDLSNRYLYNWKGILKGAGTTRRAGFHFFADQPGLSNRGNSYFVFFRLDDQKIQIYKVINDSWGSGPVKDVAHSFTANQVYDFKVIYDRITGLIRVYVNDVMSAEWTDSAPISNGSYVSFRSAECNYQVNDFKVYRSRNASENISVGAGNTNDIRYQNQNPASPSGCIRSIVTDIAGNISVSTFKNIRVDWTCSSSVSINDGTSVDIDTTYNGTQLQANWSTSFDLNSGIKKYYYSIGTTPGGTDIRNWTGTLANSVTAIGLTLLSSQIYYINVQAEDSALIKTPIISTDGQIYYSPTTGIKEFNNSENIVVFPNPGNGLFHLKINSENISQGETQISVIDIMGREVYRSEIFHKNKIIESDIDISDQSNGLYYVIVNMNGKQFFNKIVLSK